MMKKCTEDQYTKITLKLASRYESVCDQTWKDDPVAFCQWLTQLSRDWARSTWRLRKSAVTFFMERNGPHEAIEVLNNHRHTPKSNNAPQATSQKKSRRLNDDDLISLVEILLSNKRAKLDTLIAQWLVAGLITGARPTEWFGATLKDGVLTLQNAKHNESRACGEQRVIIFRDSLNESYYAMIANLVSAAQTCQSKSDFANLYEACRLRLYYINKKLWPGRAKKISFYTTRHQFSANAKSTASNQVVAALMGHRSSETATENYLTSKYGNPDMLFVDPSPDNLALVTDNFIPFAPAKDKANKV